MQNWFKKLCQINYPPSYLSIGHGYNWDEDLQRHEQFFEKKSSVLLWWWDNYKIYTKQRTLINTTHNADEQQFGFGRIDLERKIGSITFGTNERKIQKTIMNAVYNEFISKGIKIHIYAEKTYSFDQYYQRLDTNARLV